MDEVGLDFKGIVGMNLEQESDHNVWVCNCIAFQQESSRSSIK
jgi:hypothetical protein